MTLKVPRGAGPPPSFDDECTAVGPPSGAILEALRSAAEPNMEQVALDELVDLTVDFEEPPTVQGQTVRYGAALAPSPVYEDRPALFVKPARSRHLVLWLLTAAFLAVIAIGAALIRR